MNCRPQSRRSLPFHNSFPSSSDISVRIPSATLLIDPFECPGPPLVPSSLPFRNCTTDLFRNFLRRPSRDTMASILQNSSTRRSFFDLALEIRLRVYEALFGAERVSVEAELDFAVRIPPPGIREGFIRPSPRSAQLLRVCRQLLQEARPVLLDNAVFCVNRFACPSFQTYAPPRWQVVARCDTWRLK